VSLVPRPVAKGCDVTRMTMIQQKKDIAQIKVSNTTAVEMALLRQ